MVFTPASHSVGAGEDRNAFINHEGGYWLNPVPHGASLMQSTRTGAKKFELIDPFGNPKRRDRPDLFGKSRYGTGVNNSQNPSQMADRANGTHGDSAGVSGKEYDDSQDGANAAKDNEAIGMDTGKDSQDRENAVDTDTGKDSQDKGNAVDRDTGKDSQDRGNAAGTSGDMDGPQTDANGAPGDGVLYGEGTGNTEGSQSASQKKPFSKEDLMRDKLPLDTANPERRLAHPGNHTERILPAGGSTYNGNVKEEWTAPRAYQNTYIRLAPVYESTTHYQLRTGRFYTEDEAPQHDMTLPTKTSLYKREW